VNRLLDWVLAALQRPISLTDMESFSGYSRRSLQKAFHQRFGMGPMQWLRRQRLQQARQMIDTAEGKLKLGAIAQACGSTNQASFSRDFREVFGVKPSELGRLHHTSV
jgi:transcriptional regulator GlxA family with amidase domain